MTDMDDRGYDAEARRHLAALDALLARWSEETGDRLGIPGAAEEIQDATGDLPARRPHGHPTAEDEAPRGGAGQPRPGRRRWAWPSGILAVAAAVVLILVARQPEGPGPSRGEDGIPLVADGLDAASDGSFMVVPTRNPDIAVIWMLDSGD